MAVVSIENRQGGYLGKVAGWLCEFIDHARQGSQPHHDIWEETLQNYLVLPKDSGLYATSAVQYPYLLGSDSRRFNDGYSRLKDPESHDAAEALIAAEMTTLYGDLELGIKGKPVGVEDAMAGETASRYLAYVLSLESHHRSLHEWTKNKYIFGLGIMKAWYEYREEIDAFRQVEYDEDGNQFDQEDYIRVPVYDDPMLRVVDNWDFFWDPGADRICDMYGAAERFYPTKRQAMSEPNWNKAAVRLAFSPEVIAQIDAKDSEDKNFREGMDLAFERKSSPSVKRSVGYSYYGCCPVKDKDEEYGSLKNWNERRHHVIINGIVVFDEPWYGRIPFFENNACPMRGRFPGLSPLEIIRFNQDFTDSMKMSIADAVSRMIYMAPIVNRGAQVDLARLRHWRPDRPILATQTDAVAFLEYRPPVGEVYNVYSSEKRENQEAAGALGVFQGQGLGVNRASGTEAAGTLQRSATRPEAQYLLTEREYLPPLGKYIVKLGQRYIDSDEDLRKRVGEKPKVVSLKAFSSDFDIQFVGSRLETTKTERISVYREAFSLRSDPTASVVVPWALVVARYFYDNGLYEIANAVGSMDTLQSNMKIMQALNPPVNGSGANGNGTVPAGAPTEAGPAQLAGAIGG